MKDPLGRTPAQAGSARSRAVGVVLCGGGSRRMGVDKARARLGQRTLLEHAIAALSPAVDEVVLACGSRPRYEEHGLRLVLDPPELFPLESGPLESGPLESGSAGSAEGRTRGAGPAAGLLAALEQLESEWVCALACDMPRVEPAMIAALLERARAEELDACLFESERGLEPLCAVYRRSLAAPMRAALRAGRNAVLAFRDHPRADGAAPRVGSLGVTELGAALCAGDPARNLNFPEELERERAARQEAPA